MEPNKIWIASFDIGTKNFAFCIEEFDQNLMENIKKIPKTQRYDSDGVCTEKFQKGHYTATNLFFTQKFDFKRNRVISVFSTSGHNRAEKSCLYTIGDTSVFVYDKN